MFLQQSTTYFTSCAIKLLHNEIDYTQSIQAFGIGFMYYYHNRYTPIIYTDIM